MALEHILAALEEAFETEIAELQAKTAAEVAQIIADSEAKARAVHLDQIEAVQPRIHAERSQRINKARLDAQRTSLEARRELITAVLDTAQSQLAQIRRRPGFDRLLAALVLEVLDELGGSTRLEIDRRDIQLMAQCLDGLDGLDAPVAVDATLQSWGGVIGHSADGRITIDNTLEARFSQVQELCWGDIAGLLESEELDAG